MSSSPYFTSDGRCYWVVNGQRVFSTSGRDNNPGSNCAFAHSVSSRFESHDLPVETRSYPPKATSSTLRDRMMSGFPAPYYSGREQGSDPGTTSNDYYRNSVEPKKTRHGPSFQSDFYRDCHNYKDSDEAADGAVRNYKFVSGTGQKRSKRIRDNNPGVYQGDPPETRDWHQNVAHYASLGRDECRRAIDERDDVAKDYIGYEKFGDRPGHQERIGRLQRSEKHMDKRYHSHVNSHR